MTKSEIDWRLSDAPNTPKKHDVESARERGSADPNPGNLQQDAESLPAVEIRYPKDIEDDARAYKGREQRRDRWEVLLEALTVVGILGYGALAYRQSHTMLAASENSTKALQATEPAYVSTEPAYVSTERAYVTALQTTEQAYVIFGSESDELGELIDNPMPGQKRIIVLHF